MKKLTFAGFNRGLLLEKMAEETYDVLVIGGGITGCGIALDAATRGMKTAVVEMQDFAGGTSSRSTKLVHGGLRYLKQLEVKMVAEVGKERAVVYENGPHVTTPEWMLLPIYQGGTFGKYSTSLGLKVYDFLANVKKTERRKMLDATEAQKREPLLNSKGLKGGGVYVEYRTDDARLTIEVMKEAIKQGTEAVNYAKVEKLLYENGKVAGALVVDQLSKKSYKIRARKIVNAAGPWVDTLREMDRSKKGKHLQLTKGIHLVFDQKKFPLKQAIYFDTEDKRMIFAIPRAGKTYVGTTDTVYTDDKVHPRMTKEDKAYVLSAIKFMFPSVQLEESDIESSWIGLRPLIHEEGKSASEISRKDEVWVSESGLITIAGGKLTGYRKMAEMVVNLLNKQLNKEGGKKYGASKTKKMPISGGDVGGSHNFPRFVAKKSEEGLAYGFTVEEARRLVSMYGSNIDKLYKIAEAERGKAVQLGLPIDVYVQLIYAIREEMAATPLDFFIRRTGAMFFNIDWVKKWKQKVLDCMERELVWSGPQKDKFSQELDRHLRDAVTAVDEEEPEPSVSKIG
ncbi:glycerol-3-phosphate dehydrogenase/oxidase [Sutcliffiella horikoshii]|uniref:glycerol-3-phosphate dehydrogenase/oxidase n=1 Tax=Sutcliffiella horikoshii TaxID=79883 RepID=UPI001F469DA5|nr:glycerol-3-phosphate dehydrogenase/oxidase [Sutcliffiella horikoshii]MCG1022568.1 glycerol-3-phosphate dehydrogenase/oxidase [Sutcliffiella horikoshii]